jgi:hypothetical protein
MTSSKKRSWETARGKPELDPWGSSDISARNAGYESSHAQLSTSMPCGNETKKDSTELLSSAGSVVSLSGTSSDVYLFEGRRHSPEASTESMKFDQDVNHHTKLSREASCETPRNMASNSYSFSTSKSIAEEKRSADASGATVVCFGRVSCTPMPMRVYYLFRR